MIIILCPDYESLEAVKNNTRPCESFWMDVYGKATLGSMIALQVEDKYPGFAPYW